MALTTVLNDICKLNERPKLVCGTGTLDGRMWVLPVMAFAKMAKFGRTICVIRFLYYQGATLLQASLDMAKPPSSIRM
jgi:hypothetical protein